MSGYPYGNAGGNYPSLYGMVNDNYPNYPPNNVVQPPPPLPIYGDYPSSGSIYETNPSSTPFYNNYSTSGYGINQLPGGSNIYPSTPSYGGSMTSPMLDQPSQSYGNIPQRTSYVEEAPPSAFGGLYPSLDTPVAPSNYGVATGIAAAHQPPNPQPSYYPQPQSSTSSANLEQYQGTIFPAANFHVEADCQALSQAMRGLGTNEHAIIDIVVNRSNEQRQQIKLHYKSMYGRDLTQHLASELSGNFKEIVIALFDEPAQYDARSLHRAINEVREGTLRDILLTRSNSEVRAIIDVYRQMFNRDLEKDINNRIRSTDFKRLLISAVQANRDELSSHQIYQANQMGIDSFIDRNRARQDADDLYKSGAGKWGTDERTFNAIFAARNYYQLRATFEEYQQKYGKDITQVIRSEFSGAIKDAYLALIAYIRDRPGYFAESIHRAIKRLGTNDMALIRVIVTRSEIDLEQIKQRYHQIHNRSLAQDISGDTSGDYKRILLAIVK